MRYWVCISNEIFGPLEPAKLGGLKGFAPLSWACPEDQTDAASRQWKRAVSFPELAPCFFPDYPAAAAAAPARPAEEAPPARAAAGPHSGDDALAVAAINRKLDELLRAQGRQSTPSAAVMDPLSRKIDLNETTLEQIKTALQGQDQRLHTELEPLSRKLDRTEQELEDIRRQVIDGNKAGRAPANLGPVASALDQVTAAVHDQDALIHSELGPISERVAQAEKAIEEENALQRAVLEKMETLDRDLAGLRDGLALRAREPRPPARPALAAALALLVGGAGLFGAYAFSAWILAQASGPGLEAVPGRPAPRRAGIPSPEVFVRGYGKAMPLERAVTEDARARGASGEASWSVETGKDGRPAVGAAFAGPRGRRLYYYFSVDLKEGRLSPLNRGAGRALDRAEGR